MHLNGPDVRRITYLSQSLVGDEEARITIESAYEIDGFYWHNRKIKSVEKKESKLKKLLELGLVMKVTKSMLVHSF